MSRFFIYRPIFATVVSIVIVLAGAVAQSVLPVAKFPQITPPTVQVTAMFPGANPSVLAETVAAPIEQEVNGVEDMLYMSSTCTDNGSYTLNVTFETGTDMDMATVLVQNRVAIAQPKLPEEVRRQGITTKKQSTQIVQFLTLTSTNPEHDSLYLSNYATINLRDQLGRVDGVGSVSIFGSDEYSMRIWLQPERLKARGLTPLDVVSAVQEQNVQVAAGRVGEPPASSDTAFQYVVNTQGRLADEEQFKDLILKTSEDGALTRLRDVAEVELGARTYNYSATTNGQACAAIAIYQLPDANALQLSKAIRSTMDRMSERFPDGVSYQIPFDTSRFVEASIAEVYSTLFVAVALVILVIFIFLQDWRATIVPSVAIPVALVGTFGIIATFGFSINMLTLFGLVLAIGIVVDDAIVVVENTYRHLDAGLTPKEAAVKAMEEITGPIIATSLVLFAVFVPTVFMGGIVGGMYQQFALTISAAIMISTLNALTLSPALCGLFLRPSSESFEKGEFLPPLAFGMLGGILAFWLTSSNFGVLVAVVASVVVGIAAGFLGTIVNRLLKLFFVAFNRTFDTVTSAYSKVVARAVRNVVLMMVAFVALLAVTGYGFRQIPTGFVPVEDQGYAFANIQLPDASALGRTREVMDKIDKILADTAGVEDWVSISGYSILSGTTGSNNGMVAIVFEPWEERTDPALSQDAIMRDIRQKFNAIQEATCIAFVPPAIDGLGNASGFQMQLQDVEGAGMQTMQSLVEEMVAAGNAQSGLTQMNSTFRASVPQVFAEIDRTKAKKLGIPLEALFGTLQVYMGSAYINDFNRFGRTWQVRAQAESDARQVPDDLRDVYVRNSSGQMVPADTLLELSTIVGPQVIQRYNLYPTAQINGMPAVGYSSGEALDLMEQMAKQKLPPSVTFEWTGISYQEKLLSNSDSPLESPSFILMLSMILVFLVLAAQYESWTNPLAVIAVVPLAALGVVVLLLIRNADVNIYTQIGLVLLVALASKNAILIVEFAAEQRRLGLSIEEAAEKAATLRFRAILMTAFSSVLGFLPLLVAQGAGAASRQAVGNAVVGGMIAATVFAVLFVPSFFVVFQRLAELRKGAGDSDKTPTAT